ncbi:unnamed protein product, partial [Ascophyllum nodosum]
PSLSLFEKALRTTAIHDFDGHDPAYQAAVRWDQQRLRDQFSNQSAPYLACAEYGKGREATNRLKEFLSSEAVRPASNTVETGACFIVTASNAQATSISAHAEQFWLLSVGPVPSALKLAPGLLDHNDNGNSSERLTTTHGERMRMANVEGLSVELAPGTFRMHAPEVISFAKSLLEDLASKSLDLHIGNVWSDPAMVGADHHLTNGGAWRAREWIRAADVVQELTEAVDTSPSDICSWENTAIHQASDNVLTVSGVDHLLISGRGAGGQGEEAVELHMACFMDLVSFLASRPEVLRVAPRHTMRLLNAVARANIQTATVTSTPLTDAGLDGTGEVIQVVDSGLDETSCFFIDDDGGEVEHGHYFEELARVESYFLTASSFYRYSTNTAVHEVFNGGDFVYDTSRRKVIQYINLVKSDSEPSSHGEHYTTEQGEQITWLDAAYFEQDGAAGHGTHTAGSAAGATLNTPAEAVTCSSPDVLGCVGACISDSSAYDDDDLLTYYDPSHSADLDRLCPSFDCGEYGEEVCLSEDVEQTLADHGGMAQGAKLAIFDMFYGEVGLGSFAGNGVWEACLEAGCKVHSNSYGADLLCEMSELDLEYDDFMYNNPENLLVFAAGNDGDIDDGRDVCTIGRPAIAKNVLAIGSTSSGETRLTTTASNGEESGDFNGGADIDTVSFFSSYGPTLDGRIKPELVAPGDMIYSAASDGTGLYSCRLWAFKGTSMSCPVVAGAAAMVRQYFVDDSFYAADVTARGLCSADFVCEGFSPSSATVKALLINSANLMGESSDPDYFKGFGRIHMEAGMPLGGEGDLALFVADSANTNIAERTTQQYLFDVDSDAGLELRATISWIDPAATTFSEKQLIHDLDLTVIAPSGATHTMWSTGIADTNNVNERVIVDAADVENGTWTVSVWSNELTTDVQSYSLIVNGAISPATGDAPEASESSS